MAGLSSCRFGRGVAIAAVLGCVALARPARAGEPAAKGARVATPAEIAVARRLFHEAAKLEKDKQWADAAKKLAQAVGIKETPGLRFHLAFCEENMGKLVQALVDYDRAAEMISDGVKAPDVAARLDPARAALKKRVPMLTVTLPADVPGATLEVDGHAMAPAVVGQPMPLDPGQHKLEADADGYTPFQATVTLAEGDRKTTDVKLEKAAPTPAAPAATSRPRQTSLRTPARAFHCAPGCSSARAWSRSQGSASASGSR